MAKYDISDPTDLDIMHAQFDIISHKEWEEYIDLATEKDFSNKNINILKTASRKAGISKYLSPKMINWVLTIIDQLEESEEDEKQE